MSHSGRVVHGTSGARRGSQHADPLVRVLGALEVGAPGDRLGPMPVRLRRVLGVLLVSAGAVVSADRLADVVWAEGEAPRNVDGALQNLASRLRARLASAKVPADLMHRAPGYLLDLDPGLVDAVRFEDLATAARRELDPRPERAAELLDQALALWRGPAWAEFADDDFARPEAVRLQELRLAALEDRAEAALRQGLHDEATARLEALVHAEPLRERPHRQLVVAHYRAGRHGDALAVVRTHRTRLQEELGLDPSSAMRQLEAAVLSQDSRLELAGQPPEAPLEPGPAQPVPTQASARPPYRAGQAPPPAPGRQARTALPTAAGSLLGRGDDLAALHELVQPGSVVTLTGTGGVGKTSLALRLAADLAAGCADGVGVAELATVSSAEEVAPAVMTVLDLQPRQGVAPVDRLVEYLRPRTLLLVLDNCEHVVDAAAALAHAVHRGCPAVALLATSRSPLDVPEERVWAVAPLPLPPASAVDARGVAQAPSVRLFVQRASARSRTFVLDDGNAADVAEVCRRLDGVPLAIELAAARMAGLSPADLVERLSWRFRLLRGGPRTATDRHQTLRAVVDWSYNLLDEPSQRVFEVLSAFAGRFPLMAAEQLVAALPDVASAVVASGPDRDVASTVLSLVDRSMVAAASEQPTAYALLETLRAYGRERMEARGCAEQVRRAHAELYARLAVEAEGHLYRPGHVAAVERLAAAVDELRAAAAWAVEHDVALAARLLGAMAIYVEHRVPAEVPRWAEGTLAAAAREDRTVPGLAKVYGVAAAGARFAGDLDRGRALAEEGLAVAEDPAAEGYLRYLLSEISLFQGRIDEAGSLIAQVAALRPAVPVARMAELIGPLAVHPPR